MSRVQIWSCGWNSLLDIIRQAWKSCGLDQKGKRSLGHWKSASGLTSFIPTAETEDSWYSLISLHWELSSAEDRHPHPRSHLQDGQPAVNVWLTRGYKERPASLPQHRTLRAQLQSIPRDCIRPYDDCTTAQLLPVTKSCCLSLSHRC